MIVRLLGSIGDVREAEDGEAALEALFDKRPDLVITDVMMRRMDGIELTKNLKSDPSLRTVPVILVTAKNTPRDVIEGINAGVRHYLTKPFSPRDLLEKVRRALR
jgi:CheY-like chemotaxis protein